MQRILILGSCGAGKSTLAKKLHRILGLELIHLDQAYWKPHWTEPSKEEWEAKVKQLIQKETWIMDGNYGGSLDLRIPKADTIILLNYSTLTCLYRVLKRILLNYGKVRPDMTEGCPERFDWEFLHYVLMFKMTRGRALVKQVQQLSTTKRTWIIQNNQALENLLKDIKESKN